MKLGRFVRPGEKGIFIFAPTVGVKDNSQNQPQTQDASKKSSKGKKAAETPKAPAQQPETQLLGFRGVYVFDVEQTGGEELPETRKPLDVAETLEKLTAFAQSQKMSIEQASWIAPNKATSYRGAIRCCRTWNPLRHSRFCCAK